MALGKVENLGLNSPGERQARQCEPGTLPSAGDLMTGITLSSLARWASHIHETLPQ